MKPHWGHRRARAAGRRWDSVPACGRDLGGTWTRGAPALTNKDRVCVESNKVSGLWRATTCIPGATAGTRLDLRWAHPSLSALSSRGPQWQRTLTLTGAHTHTCSTGEWEPVPVHPGHASPFAWPTQPVSSPLAAPRPQAQLWSVPIGACPCRPSDSSSGHRPTAQRTVRWPRFPVCVGQGRALPSMQPPDEARVLVVQLPSAAPVTHSRPHGGPLSLCRPPPPRASRCKGRQVGRRRPQTREGTEGGAARPLGSDAWMFAA